MGMEGLDKLQYAVQIISGIRDILVLLESNTEKEMPVTICIVFETAMEKAVSLLEDAAKEIEAAGEAESKQS